MSEIIDKAEHPDDKPSSVLVILLVLPLLGILVALLMIATEERTPESGTITVADNSPSGRLIDFPAPDFTLNDLDGNIVRLEDYRGRRLFINFWATWCVPCVRELPALEEFIAEQGDAGVAVLAITFADTSQQVRNFFAEIAVENIPVGFDPDSSIKRAYGVQNLPTTFIVDENGIVRAMKLGEMTSHDMEQYVNLLDA